MLVNICCSGSSGSTFFAQLLNRHPDIVCGSELGMFSKPIFYYNYLTLKRYLTIIERFGVSSAPYFLERSILRDLENYGLNQNVIRSWIAKTTNLFELTDLFAGYITKCNDKKIWAEKTPENIYYIKEYAKTFPDAKIIHIVRDPRDVILSLMRRGHNKITAMMNWLNAVASIQPIKNYPNLLEIRYEDLILCPELTLQKVCTHLGVKFDMSYFISDEYSSIKIKLFEGHNSWNNNPNSLFSKTSIGRYKSKLCFFNNILNMRISKEFAITLGVKQLTVLQLMDLYKYNLEDKNTKEYIYKNKISAKIYSKGNVKNYLAFCTLKHLLKEKSPIPLVEY